MSAHKNSTPATGIFNKVNIKVVKNVKFVNFPIDDSGKQQLKILCRRCFTVALLELLEEDDKGEFLFREDKFKAKTLPFDLGTYYESILKQFELSISMEMALSESQIQALILALKTALFYDFKIIFKDSRSDRFICNGNKVEPLSPRFDFELLISWALHYFFQFISNN